MHTKSEVQSEADQYHSNVIKFDIPSQDLSAALIQFGDQAGVSVLIQSAITNQKSSVLQGIYSVQDGLDEILAGTNLKYKISSHGIVVHSKNVGQQLGFNKKKRSAKKGFLASLIALFSAGAAVSSSAQEGAGESVGLEEIVVTARKREESLLDTPLSISAMTGKQLEEMGAENFEDYAVHVPGLSFTQRDPAGSRGAGPSLSVRGINGAAGNGDSAIGYYLNDTPVGSLNIKMIDVERVEVLKGPQGTLYGGRAMGGLIKVVTNKAKSDEFEFESTADISSTAHGGENYELNAVANLPLIEDRLGLRITGYSIEKDGYVDWIPGAYREPLPRPGVDESTKVKDVNDESTYGGRVSLSFEATDSLNVTFESLFEKVETDARSEWDQPLEPYFGELIAGGLTLEPSKAELSNYSLTFNWDINDSYNFVSNTSLTNYDTFNAEEGGYYANSIVDAFDVILPPPYDVFNSDVELFQSSNILTGRDREIKTQEFRLSFDNGGALRWMVGAFYQEQEEVNTFFWEIDDLASTINPNIALLNALFSAGLDPLTDNIGIDQVSKQEVEEFGLFGELNYQLTEQLTFTLGLRYFDNKMSYSDDRQGYFGGPLTNIGAAEDGVNPKIGLSYQLNDDAMIYASATEGFRRAGANATGLIPSGCDAELAALGYSSGAPESYGSDTLRAYELGYKGSLAGGRATVEAAVFYNDWQDKQQQVFLPGCGFSFSGNVGSAEIYGAELTTNVLLTDNLTLALNLAHMDATVAEDTPEAGVFDGDPLPITPDWQMGASLNYVRPINNEFEGFARLDYQYRDEIIDGVSGATLDSYDTINLKVGVIAENYTVTLYADNLTDERGQLYDGSFLLVGQQDAFHVYTTRPRTVGLRVNWKY